MVTKGISKAEVLSLVGAMLLLVCRHASADFTFSVPTNVGPPVNTASYDRGPSISADGLELYLHSLRGGGVGGSDLWVAQRAGKDDPWTEPVNLGARVNSSAGDYEPSISADGLELYFCSRRSGGYGQDDIWVTTRATTSDLWGDAVNAGPTLNSSESDWDPSASADGLSLYFSSTRPGGFGATDLWVARRANKGELWGEAVNLGPRVNGGTSDLWPSISADGLWLFFGSDRFSDGPPDLWVTTRATIDDDWGEPINLGPTINTPYGECSPDISSDGLTLYFADFRPMIRPSGYGDTDLWQAPLIPIVDWNGDGKVDHVELSRMIEHWDTDDPSCDIGPTPMGDGIVNIHDLRVLTQYLTKDVYDPTLAAHWTLDETEGQIAQDAAGDHGGAVMGDAVWQSDVGRIDGALAFDGVDDFVAIDLTLDPKDGPFSILAWIKGGAPGQVVASQADIRMGRLNRPGCSWLAVDPILGILTSDLADSQLVPPEAAVVTDGQWHRVGLVWDESANTGTLYVDGVKEVVHSQPTRPTAQGGFQIGVGGSLEPGTYWTGLIDDVRIYNRAVKP